MWGKTCEIERRNETVNEKNDAVRRQVCKQCKNSCILKSQMETNRTAIINDNLVALDVVCRRCAHARDPVRANDCVLRKTVNAIQIYRNQFSIFFCLFVGVFSGGDTCLTRFKMGQSISMCDVRWSKNFIFIYFLLPIFCCCRFHFDYCSFPLIILLFWDGFLLSDRKK